MFASKALLQRLKHSRMQNTGLVAIWLECKHERAWNLTSLSVPRRVAVLSMEDHRACRSTSLRCPLLTAHSVAGPATHMHTMHSPTGAHTGEHFDEALGSPRDQTHSKEVRRVILQTAHRGLSGSRQLQAGSREPMSVPGRNWVHFDEALRCVHSYPPQR